MSDPPTWTTLTPLSSGQPFVDPPLSSGHLVIPQKRKAAEIAQRRLTEVCAILKQGERDGENTFDWSNFGNIIIDKSQAVPDMDTGRGVFATTDFSEGDVITEYCGTILDYDTITSDQTHDADLKVTGCRVVIRGYQQDSEFKYVTFNKNSILVNVGQIMNDARDERNNSRREILQPNEIPRRVKNYATNVIDKDSKCTTNKNKMSRIFTVATTDIKKGQEIYTSYGKEYWTFYENSK